ncbi:hypothetical protein Ddye_006316 [Dipteronia dyeriana]|uniref:Zinc finger PMZ-type domain-containing protein n=1 Tax=Dipteronia dyeriana TaxID=168575 RepID=A0AAD9XIT8_9ROSI|nr:hypothetical protein Ddye_006316 [Dipteronia dyeriana]
MTRDGVGLGGDDWDGVGLGGDDGVGVGLRGNNNDCIGLRGDDGDDVFESPCRGILLSAVALDANSGLFLLIISGIPCSHAMAAIGHNYGREALRDMVPTYVHQYLTKSAHMQTYRGMIHPLPDQKKWSEIESANVLPLPFEVQPGRPKMQRKRESGEKGK